ncbi:hypothetical protein LA080_009013 [Diaporthe eres]|nr:hypothetical protein LA080_009013 [Diaporthe eres]
MAAINQDRKKATDLQKELETLLALEKLGALPTPAADEVRNIIAEGIADKFGETYRTFPCARLGTEIRRDAVPKQCALRKSVEGFVAEARATFPPSSHQPQPASPSVPPQLFEHSLHSSLPPICCQRTKSPEAFTLESTTKAFNSSPEKVSKAKVQYGQKKAFAKTTTAEQRTASKALAQVNSAQRDQSSTIGQAARNEETAPRKTPSPEKQQPETSPNPSNPTKDGASKDWQQTRFESGEKAWDVLLAQKAAGIKTTARTGTQQKPTTQGMGGPVTQTAGVGPRKDGRTAAAATSKNGTGAPKVAMTSQRLATAAGTSGKAPDRRTTTGDSSKPKPSSSGKASIASSEDLIDFGF